MTMNTQQLLGLARIAAKGHYEATADPDRSPSFDDYWTHNPVDRAVWLEIVKAVLTTGKAHDEFMSRQGKPVPLPGLGAPLAPPGGAIPSPRGLEAASAPEIEPQPASVGSGYPFADDPKPEGGPELAQWKRRNFARLYGVAGTLEKFKEQFKRDHPPRFPGAKAGFLEGLDMAEAEKRELSEWIAQHDRKGNMPAWRLDNVRRMLALYDTPEKVASRAASDIDKFDTPILWANPVYFGTLAGQGLVSNTRDGFPNSIDEFDVICVLNDGRFFRIGGAVPTGGLFRAHVEGNKLQFVKHVPDIEKPPAGTA